MENAHSESIENLSYEFLLDRKVKDVFAKADYLLRGGVHIQREHPKPEEIFRFIERNYESLQAYYSDLFQLVLSRGGEEQISRYYFLDFEDETNRSKIPSDHRYRRYLETEHIIIGMLFFKMYKLDANIELDSVTDFIQLLFTEYEEEKNGLFKLIASAKNDKSTDYIDKDVVKEITNAFEEFEKLGWITWMNEEKSKFKYMPSFERLRKKYQSQILSIDELINTLENAK